MQLIWDLIWGQLGKKIHKNWCLMKLISWNVKGAGKKGFYSQVKFLMSNDNPDVIVCIETSVNSNRVHKIIERINLPNL